MEEEEEEEEGEEEEEEWVDFLEKVEVAEMETEVEDVGDDRRDIVHTIKKITNNNMCGSEKEKN